MNNEENKDKKENNEEIQNIKEINKLDIEKNFYSNLFLNPIVTDNTRFGLPGTRTQNYSVKSRVLYH